MTRTALITGASGGIGKEFAHIYAQHGYDVVLVARSEGKLYQLKNNLEKEYGHTAHVFACDLSKEGAAYDVFDYKVSHGIDVDVLVNNAGFGDFGNFWEVDSERQRSLLQVDIVTLVELTRLFLPSMIDRGWGRVVNMSSVASFCAGPRMSLYYASKAFVRSFSEAVAEETRGTGVRVTAVCPGPTSTGFEKNAQMKDSRMFTFFRPATPERVAKAGVAASQRGRTLLYYGLPTKAMNIGARLLPRAVTRRFAAKING